MILISDRASSIEKIFDYSKDHFESNEIHIETSKIAIALPPLLKVSTHISIKKNKKSIPIPKMSSLDLNQPYLEFKE